MQFTATFFIEVINIIVLCAVNDTVNIIFNFTAIAIIAGFDNFVYESLKNESFKELHEEKFQQKIFVIKHTSSRKCKLGELTDVKDENDELRPMKIAFKDRETLNKVYFALYRFLRSFYVSFYFYFAPFTVIVISTLVPIYYRSFIPQTS